MFATRTLAAPSLITALLLFPSCEPQSHGIESPTEPLEPSLATAENGEIHVPAGFPTIQGAIDAAVSGSVIVVAPGTYNERIDFLGKAVTVRSSNGPGSTIINGSGSTGSVVTAVSGEGPATVLEGFTITGGNALEGGGMRNVGSSPTVRDCHFTGNAASDRGGGMYNHDGTPTIIRTHFELNSATAMGGGVFNLEASPTIRESRFTQNTANKGGGMRNYLNSHPTVTNCVFENNHAGEEGGGMDNRKNSNPLVMSCLFVGNSAGSGGAMHNYVGRLVPSTGNPTLINVVMFGNSASEGAGMRNNDPHPLILNSTIAFNTGSGISSRNGSSPVIQNTVVWGNSGGSFSGKSAKTSIVTFSDIEGGFPGLGNLNVDPLFLDPAGSDLHLAPGSPLIDAGELHNEVPPVDYDGNPRVAGNAVDIGAYEFGGGSGENLPPVASFPTPNCLDLGCSFTDTSTDFDGSIESRAWDFGDGATSSVENPNHTYDAEGSYLVTLTVTDDGGASDTANRTITVGGATEPLTVTGISPSILQGPGTFAVTINGTGFGPDARVILSSGKGPTPEVSGLLVIDSTTIEVTLTVKPGGPGRDRPWDVTVTSGGSSATLPDGLTVRP